MLRKIGNLAAALTLVVAATGCGGEDSLHNEDDASEEHTAEVQQANQYDDGGGWHVWQMNSWKGTMVVLNKSNTVKYTWCSYPNTPYTSNVDVAGGGWRTCNSPGIVAAPTVAHAGLEVWYCSLQLNCTLM